MRMAQMVNAVRRATWCELALFLVALVVGSAALAQAPPPNYRCQPTTMPVTSCNCYPGDDEKHDRCIGTLPKQGGTMYGNVGCMPHQGATCNSGAQTDCGIVVMCDCIECTTHLIVLGCYPATPTQRSCLVPYSTAGARTRRTATIRLRNESTLRDSERQLHPYAQPLDS